MDELEDAMGSSFAEFIEKFPIIELKDDDRFTGGKVFRVRTSLPAVPTSGVSVSSDNSVSVLPARALLHYTESQLQSLASVFFPSSRDCLDASPIQYP